MDTIGGFREVEIDGKPYLVFNLNQPPQIDIPAGEAAMDSDGGNDQTEYQIPQIHTLMSSPSGGHDDQTEYQVPQFNIPALSSTGEAAMDSGGDDDQTEDQLSQIDTSTTGEAAMDPDNEQTDYQSLEVDTSIYSTGAYDGPDYSLFMEEVKAICTSSYEYNQRRISGGNDDNHHLQPLFVCPNARINSLIDQGGMSRGGWFSKINASPHFCSNQLDDNLRYNHHVIPFNNKQADINCSVCDGPSIDTDHYFCVTCKNKYHKECVESPLQMIYPSHLKNPLQLYFCSQTRPVRCISCRKQATGLVYYSDVFDISMHVHCSQATIPFFLDQPKRHIHTLALFPRQASLTCNVCGLINKLHLTFVCPRCDFVSHADCLNIPNIIRISRHHHRVSFSSSRRPGKWSCGVCRREVDSEYGSYSCNKCTGYVVHIRCALRSDVWDGIDLEGVPEDDEDEDVDPFERIAEGVIRHFSHHHHLRLKISRVFDEKKFCQACVLPIYEGGFYACVDHCDFILHKRCANAPRKKQHALCPQPLKLAPKPMLGITRCGACNRQTNGFSYIYEGRLPYFVLDMRCASVSEPFEYQGHKHPLYLSLEPGEKPRCRVCKSTNYQKVLNCIEFECDFVICFKCATLPYMVKYKHDKHYLTFCHGDEANDKDWCELCEGRLATGGEKGFYNCDDCSTTLHIDCLLGTDPYVKPGQTIQWSSKYDKIHFLLNGSSFRPFCVGCDRRCQYPTYFYSRKGISCSLKCLNVL